MRRGIRVALILQMALSLLGVGRAYAEEALLPNIVLVSVDTLRADRLSSYGYRRRTSPHIDELLNGGARFTQARTVEPLTAPALASMLTSIHPHEHGSTRNGLRVRSDLVSVSKIFRHRGYRAAAIVGSWTLRDKLWGMADHFDFYDEFLNRARWLGLVRREATGEDLSDRAIEWLAGQVEEDSTRPVFLWVHYVEPHAPYKLHRDFVPQLGAAPDGDIYSAESRYDSEVAYVDFHIGRLVDEVYELLSAEETIVVLVSDHGESLGEHGYWGHGRHVYDATLHIPMGIVWSGQLEPKVLDAPALIIDLAPTLLGLAGLPVPEFFQGLDWSPVLRGQEPEPTDRVTYFQSHKGATSPKENQEQVRQKGLLEVARLEGGNKEIYRVTNSHRRFFDVFGDPGEEDSEVRHQSELSEDLAAWLERVREGLAVADDLPPPSLSAEDLEALRALGYID